MSDYDVYLGINPDGEAYGFPKRVPEEYIDWKSETYFEFKPNIKQWAASQGYPSINGNNVSLYHIKRLKSNKLIPK